MIDALDVVPAAARTGPAHQRDEAPLPSCGLIRTTDPAPVVAEQHLPVLFATVSGAYLSGRSTPPRTTCRS